MEWFWEIQQAGGGPHYYLQLEIPSIQFDITQQITPLLSGDYIQQNDRWIHRNSGATCQTSIRIEPSRLWIERRWGNDGIEDDQFLFKLIEITPRLWQWKVLGGGEGYESILFQEGSGIEQLIQYSVAKTFSD